MSRKRPAPEIIVDVSVEAGAWPPPAGLHTLVRRAATAAVRATGVALAGQPELSAVFTDDAHIRLLNRKFRRRDGATNVLSFPGPKDPGGAFGPLLGDIVLARETIEKEAEIGGIAVSDHVAHLIVHGFLHLLGYDHANEAEAAVMEGLESAILADLGFPDPYADD
jgi:probable rRNA maturation factor